MKLKLHHVGIVVKDIPEATAKYVARFGYEVKTEVLHDLTQSAFVQFLKLPGDSSYLEFVSPGATESKLKNALERGGGLNHLCYATEDIESACRELRAQGMVLLHAPVSAVAFQGRRIAWLMGRDKIPIELVEQGSDADL